jgi:protein disulfide-isomerase-like protein
MNLLVAIGVLAIAATAFASEGGPSDVLILSPDNFDAEIGGDKPALVEFFAPWCGHCKSLAPEYDILATTFAKQPVKIASVDADKHRELGSRFGVSGFPTIKYFPAGSKEPEDYSGGRTAPDMVDFINRKAGTSVRIKSSPSAVTVLTPSNFDSVVLDNKKDVLVEFYAPWCGHCKKLAPDYDKAAASLEGEETAAIAKVDCDDHKELCSKYGVSGYPTLKFFPKDNKEGEAYNGGRTPKDFVEFFNQRSGTERSVGGGFSAEAGRIESLDELASRFKSNPSDRSKILKEAEGIKANDHKNAEFAKFYTLAMKRIIEKGDNYAGEEVSRLQRMLTGTIAAKNAAQFNKRINILKQFA